MRCRGARRCEVWCRDLRRRDMGSGGATATASAAASAPDAMGSGGKAAAAAATTPAADLSLLLRASSGRKRRRNEKESGKRANIRTHGFRAPHRAPLRKRLTAMRVSKICRRHPESRMPKAAIGPTSDCSYCGIAAHNCR